MKYLIICAVLLIGAHCLAQDKAEILFITHYVDSKTGQTINTPASPGYYMVGFAINGIWGIGTVGLTATFKGGRIEGGRWTQGQEGFTPIKSHAIYGQLYWTGHRWRWETNEFFEEYKNEDISICCIGNCVNKEL